MSGTRLATWGEVHAHLAATYGGSAMPDGALVLCVTLPATTTARARKIAMEVRPVPELGAWFKITCAIGPMHHRSPSGLLAANVRPTIGSYCTHDGQLALRQTLPVEGLHTADLDETVRTLAQLAVDHEA
jgi:hypothetical protein